MLFIAKGFPFLKQSLIFKQNSEMSKRRCIKWRKRHLIKYKIGYLWLQTMRKFSIKMSYIKSRIRRWKIKYANLKIRSRLKKGRLSIWREKFQILSLKLKIFRHLMSKQTSFWIWKTKKRFLSSNMTTTEARMSKWKSLKR